MEPTTCSVVDTSLHLNVVPPSRDTAVDVSILVEELERLSSENKRLTEALNHLCDSYLTLQKHLTQLIMNSPDDDAFEKEGAGTPSRKRKAESEIGRMNLIGHGSGAYTECSTITDEEDALFKRPNSSSPKVSKVLVRTDASDSSLYVRDGYQWRKYGQKVTRDNPSPRAYFKCSYAPNCPVKKKVQKSVEDPTILVTTYEGEHNHGHHQAEISMLSSSQLSETPAASAAISSVPASSSSSPTFMNGRRTVGPTVTLDLVQSRLVENNNNGHNQKSATSNNIRQQFLVQQMATSLTRDPNFAAALATAISGKFLEER